MPEETAALEDEKGKKERKKPKRTIDTWKKKKWFTIYAPNLFDRRELAETIAEKPETLINRVISVSARDVSNQPKKQHISLLFKVNDVQGLKAFTKLMGHEIKSSFLKRLIRRRSSKIETNQVVELKNKEKAKVKTVILSVRKLRKNQETAIRKIMMEKIDYEGRKKDFDDLVQELVFGHTASKIESEAKKIGLIKRIEVVSSRLIEK